jgi:hypothetical protein
LTGDLLVITPSRNRPQSIARLLDAIHSTSKMKTHLHVGVDDDDPQLESYREVMKAGRDGDMLFIGKRKGLCGWTNEIAVPAAENYKYLASFGDDHIPRTPGWDKALIRAIERMGGTGFSYPWDYTREDIPEAAVMSSDIVRELGWMSMPDLEHWYQDTVWADLGRGAGCIKHLRAISVEHDWKSDQTAKESSKALIADRDAYYSWRKTRMADDIKILRELIESKAQSAAIS